jgi:hypothetical protein
MKNDKKQATKYRAELEWLLNELRGMSEFDLLKYRIAFRADIFERLVESGTVIPMVELSGSMGTVRDQ